MIEIHRRTINNHDTFVTDDNDDCKCDDGDNCPHDCGPGEFKHDQWMAVLALPNILFIFIIAGRSLIVLLTVAAILLSMMNYSRHQNILEVYMISVVVCHVFIMFSALPLLWLSLSNLCLLFFVSAFVLFTGLWGALHFKDFRQSQSYIISRIEEFLLAVYPAICVCLWTWQTCWFISPLYAAYMFLCYGFVVLQVVLSPSIEPSFRQQAAPNVIRRDISGSRRPYSAIVCLAWCVTPAPLYIITNATVDIWALLTWPSLIRIPFIMACSAFLTSFLHHSQLHDQFRLIEYIASLPVIRYGSASVMTFLISPMLYTYRVTSSILVWLPVVACTHVAYGLSLSRRRYAFLSVPAAVLCCMTAAILIFSLPWSVDHHIPNTAISIHYVYVVLLLTWCVSIYCPYSMTHNSLTHASAVFTFHKLAMTCAEICLLLLGQYTRMGVVLIAGIGLYLTIRLFQIGKVLRYCVEICISCDITKLSFAAASLLPMFESPAYYHYFTVFSLAALMVHQVLNKRYITSVTQMWILAWCYLLVVYLILSSSLPLVIAAACNILFGQQISLFTVLGLWLLVMGLVLMAMADGRLWVTYFSIITIITGAIISFGYPQLSFSLLSLFQWLTTIDCLLIGFVILTRSLRKVQHIWLLSIFTGPVLSLHFTSQIYNSDLDYAKEGLFMVVSTCVLLMTLVTFRARAPPHTLANNLFYGCVAVMVCLVLLHLLTLRAPIDLTTIRHNITASAIVCVYLSILLKIYSVYNKSLPYQVTPKRTVRTHLPLLSNIYTSVAYILLCLSSPFSFFYHDLWICSSTVIFFCLQSDNVQLTQSNLKKQTNAPLLLSLFLVGMCALYRSVFWSSHTVLDLIQGFAEVVVITSTLPVYFVFYGLVWLEDTLLLSPLVVVFMLPWYALLFIIGSSPASWLLGACGLAASSWMMYAKLPLNSNSE